MSTSPRKVDETVEYPDGVALSIDDIAFAEETGKGPGSFPGREFALLEMTIENGSKRELSLSTVVITVLDSDDQPVDPVYADEAKVQDFSGAVGPGKSVTAKYAFAVAKKSQEKVTVVVDFDGVHTSAVFRGPLG